ncbi:hypothetical protein ACLMJK_004345 [Lecanora helva]
MNRILTTLTLTLLIHLTSASSPNAPSAAAAATAPLHTATLYHFPPSSAPLPLATLLYIPHQPHLSSLESFIPPPNTTSTTSTTRLGIYLPNNTTDLNSPHLRTSATATYSFHAPYTGRFRLLVDPKSGECIGVSWRAWWDEGKGREEGKKEKGKRKGGGKEVVEDGRGDFDVVLQKEAPVVVFDKPAKGKGGQQQGAGQGHGVDGEEEVVEKTFLQKYWWLLIGVAFLAMTGGGPEK